MTLEELARKIDDLHMQVMLLGRKKRRRSGLPLGRPPRTVTRCMKLIELEMEGLRRVRASRAKARLISAGYSASTINNARKRLGLQAVKDGNLWYWVRRHG